MLYEYYKEILDKYSYNNRPFIDYIIKQLSNNWYNKNLFIIEAPTGYGKSTITATLALKAYKEYSKLIIAFPLRTLLEDQYSKLSKVIGDYRVLGKRYMHEQDSRYLIKPITLTTIDTLALTMFGIAPEDLSNVVKNFNEWTGTIQGSTGHYLFSWASVALSDIILDEVHLLSDSTKSLSFLLALIEHVIINDQKIVLMSATIPNALKNNLDNALNRYSKRVLWLRFNECIDNDFIDNRKKKSYEVIVKELGNNKLNVIKSWIDAGVKTGKKKVLVIFNTINDAIELYEDLKKGYENCLLLHSRFSDKDREYKNELLQKVKHNDNYIIISTQVVEAGVDISSDLFISELAPANSLIQRFGRFLRYDEHEGLSYVWYEPFQDNRYKVYDLELCKRTLEYIKNNCINMHIPIDNGYEKLLNHVYYEDDFNINKNRVDEMLLIFTNFGNISTAVKLFYESEGSLVKEGYMIPITISKDEQSIIPISYSLFKTLIKDDKVINIVKQDRIVDIDSEKIKSMNEIQLLSCIMKNNIRAFLVDAHYDNDKGLMI
ncbi:MAG: CRISPR-associated helicase Cas3 [Candidatus Nitrosocaldaceae archaeon]|nr:MAG: CRISPR-associated helicase Cas3 [Candidatus Nitrosocaldaceae archaeon]